MIVDDLPDRDIPACCDILNEIIRIGGTTAYEKPLSNDDFRHHFLVHGIVCLVCKLDTGDVLGFQSLTESSILPDKWADIATFADASKQIKGVGTALFSVTKERAEANAIEFINATIRADNAPGLAYYNKMGFVDYNQQTRPLSSGEMVVRLSKRFTVNKC